MKKQYTIFTFILDLTLTVLTGGLWVLWKMFKFMAERS